MTALFLLLLLGGAAGLAHSFSVSRRAAEARPAAPAFEAALTAASEREEALERRLAALEDKVALLEARPGPEPESFRREEAPAGLNLPAGVPGGPWQRRPDPLNGGRRVSARLREVWRAAEACPDPLEISRRLNMGISEVETALKVRDLLPSGGRA